MTVLDDPPAAPERSCCDDTQGRSNPVDKIFLLLASLIAVPEVVVMQGNVVINRDVTVISVGDGQAQKSD